MSEVEEDKWWERTTPFEELEANAKIIRQTPYGLQDGNGTDVTLIPSSLNVSPLERLRRNDAQARHFERMHGRVEK